MPLDKRAARKRACNLGAMLLIGWVAGCTVGPNYKKPAAPVPAKWDVEEPFREAAPKDAVPKTAWWNVFHDDELNGLETDLLVTNQPLTLPSAQDQQGGASPQVQNALLSPTLGGPRPGTRQAN